MYRHLSQKEQFDLEVWYCSAHGLQGEVDREFGTRVKWDVPVLEGYRYRFLKNFAFKPGIYSFWGLINPGLISLLFSKERGLLVVHGWGYFSNLLALAAGRLAGHTVCLRGETPACHEVQSGWLRRFFVRNVLGRLAHFFLFIGEENRKFYRRYGLPASRLRFTPYAVDNEAFRAQAAELLPQRNTLRKALNLPVRKTIVLFSGKYIPKKRPMDLLMAFGKCNYSRQAHLVFMGEGALRSEMEQYIKEQGLVNVTLTGFVNQSEVARYYAAADLFVMCSGLGETWGLSTNEAMNFGLPLLLSDLTGCHADLVEPGRNGFVFQTGNTDMLAEKLDALLAMPPAARQRLGQRSREIVDSYSFESIAAALTDIQHPGQLSPQKLPKICQ